MPILLLVASPTYAVLGDYASAAFTAAAHRARRLFGALGYVPPAEYEATCYPVVLPAGAGTQ